MGTIAAAVVTNSFLLLIVLRVESFFLDRSLLPACPPSVREQVYTDIRIHSAVGRGNQVSVKGNTALTCKAGSPTVQFSTLSLLESDQPFRGQKCLSWELEHKQIKLQGWEAEQNLHCWVCGHLLEFLNWHLQIQPWGSVLVMTLVMTSQDMHQLSMLFRGWKSKYLHHSKHYSLATDSLGTVRLHRLMPTNAEASSWLAAYAAHGSAPALLSVWHKLQELFSFLTERGKPLLALPAAIHQHDQALPYWSIAHRQLNLSQGHLSPTVTQLHRQSILNNRYWTDHTHRPRGTKQDATFRSWWCIFN